MLPRYSAAYFAAMLMPLLLPFHACCRFFMLSPTLLYAFDATPCHVDMLLRDMPC